jgi:hypothetical protein
MMSAIENPKMSMADLNKIEDAIKSNHATADIYQSLDNYLSFIGVKENFFLNKLKENNIDDYDDFIRQRGRRPSSTLNVLVGVALGIVSSLKTYISGK